ncbi:hypothetical protein SFRURICE_003946 [Spodoptera frugiperda]|nr:hypothetical protein SFRURICE_003946 [Spodoptera frugiperda]
MAILYYIFGAAAFGLARGRTSLDTALFPLEFTTSGGLEHVSGHVRILYGCYVEGAMLLLSCGLAALRRHSSAAFKCMTDKYRLYDSK